MSMARFVVVALPFCALLPSASVHANSEFDYLMGDIQKFEEDVQAHTEAESAAKKENLYQLSDDFFPIDEKRNEGGREFEPFVNVRIDGVPVDLTDVPSDTWFAPYVRDVASLGIVSGYRGADGRPLGLFGPDDSVTIEQLAKMAIEATGHILSDCYDSQLRNESAKGSWSEQYILCAEHLGWAVYSDGSVVDASRPATRSEVVITVLQSFDVLFGRALGTIFTDVTTSTEFSGAIERAAADNVVSGYANSQGSPTGEFGPRDPVNRAAMAKILSLALQIYGQ